MAKVVFKVGDDVSTDIIYPGRFMATVLPTETPQFAFVDYPDFNAKIKNKEFCRRASSWPARISAAAHPASRPPRA